MTYQYIGRDVQPRVADISAYKSAAVSEMVLAGKLDPLLVYRYEQTHRARPELLRWLRGVLHD